MDPYKTIVIGASVVVRHDRSPPVTLASYVSAVLILAVPLLIQLPINMTGKAAEVGSSAEALSPLWAI